MMEVNHTALNSPAVLHAERQQMQPQNCPRVHCCCVLLVEVNHIALNSPAVLHAERHETQQPKNCQRVHCCCELMVQGTTSPSTDQLCCIQKQEQQSAN
jgi:hypothetical protein